MAIREIMGLDGSLPTAEPTSQTDPSSGRIITTRATKFLAVFRVLLGFEFLWAFLDKTFGWATPPRPPTRLDQRRLTHQGLPQLRRRRPLRVDFFHASPAPPGRTGCSCSACSASASPSSPASGCGSPPSAGTLMMAGDVGRRMAPGPAHHGGEPTCPPTRSSTTTIIYALGADRAGPDLRRPHLGPRPLWANCPSCNATAG